MSSVKDLSMKTLDYWEDRLTTITRTIECAEMRILSGHDNKPPVFTGPGRIDIKNSTEIDFTMHATSDDNAEAVRLLKRAKENPYKTLKQFRLEATDYQGTVWSCGWTTPQLKGFPKIGWPLTGRLNSLMTHAEGPWVSDKSSVELVFHPKLRLPMDKKMVTVVSVDDKEVGRQYSAGQQTVQILDSEIKFSYRPFSDSLWVMAETSDKLRHPHIENWIGEPLLILLGHLVYPRLVARNFGDGSAHVWLRPSPRQLSDTSIASLLDISPLSAGEEFWHLYSSLLTLIAEDKDEQGHPNFEAHSLTRFYEEIIQATKGSRWVLCMTLSSVAEGIIRLLNPTGQKVKIDNYMKKLVSQNVLEDENQHSWTKVRHAVMHGQLVSPWATEEEDTRLYHLADLVRRLTHELIRRKERYRRSCS